MNKYSLKSGQVLLMIILVSTVLLTIGLSLLRSTTQETKIAKLEEDSKRALAAAEAGLDAALQKQSGSVLISDLVGTNFSGSAIVSTSQSTVFNTPVLQKDEQFTFYLTEYIPADPNSPTPTPQQFLNLISIPLGLNINRVQPAEEGYCDGNHAFAVEISFINLSDGTVVDRKLIDSCTTKLVPDAKDEDKVAFGESFDLTSPADIMILKILTKSTQFPGAVLSVNKSSGDWYPQGKMITSSATTETGVTKKIQLFQSYPQLPSEFMMTSF